MEHENDIPWAVHLVARHDSKPEPIIYLVAVTLPHGIAVVYRAAKPHQLYEVPTYVDKPRVFTESQ